jgi:CDP-glycerol glycerophosphotransferase (TagB/SpsB family)
MKTLANKQVYIAPYSPMSMQLAKDIDANVVGYIDKSAKAENVYKIENIKEYEYILIYSPNHYKAIYSDYIKAKIPKSKIILVSKDKSGYHYYSNKFLFALKERVKNIKLSMSQSLCSIKSIKKDDRVLLVSPDFIDINSKYLFLYMLDKELDVYIATDNKSHYDEYKKISNKVLLYPSIEYYYIASTSKIKVIERIITSDIIKSTLASSYILQLWHGIALKRLNNMNSGLDIDCVVSTSKWASENNFSKFFDTKMFLESGYPRCDVFARELTDRDYLMTDSDTLEYINQNRDKKVVVYMPTYRENSFASSPLDFEKLNEYCKANDIIFIVKMHPFELLEYFDTLQEVRLSNVIFYKAGCDIYPLLKSSDMLVTDYSSIYFDYLLANKPIVYFVYDIDEYIGSRGKFMLDFDEYSAGDRAYSLQELFDMMSKNLCTDEYRAKRERLRDILFDNHQLASESIYNHLRSISLRRLDI